MTSNQQDLYDRQLAKALDMHKCTDASDGITTVMDKARQMNRFLYNSVITAVNDFKSDMQELSEKFASAGKKIGALILLPNDMLVLDDGGGVTTSVAPNNLSFMPILIKPSVNYAPPSVAISMVSSDEEKNGNQAAALRLDLESQLEWFQKYGRDGGLLTVTEKGLEKPKPRHLSIVAETKVAAQAA